jgi:tetratricopeptide (TPR) repeat protein
MQWRRHEPKDWPETTGVIVLECPPGEARDGVVARWLGRRDAGGPTWRLRCRSQEGGAWAGLDSLVEDLAGTLRERAPDLLARHGQELCLVVPALRSQLTFAQNLTDTADPGEQTRNYPADRAYRSLQGLVDLISEWHELSDAGPWSIACEDYEHASALVRRFFAELMRRRGSRLGLQLLLVAGSGRGQDVLDELEPSTITATVRLAPEPPPAPAPAPSPAAMTRLAIELEQQLAHDPTAQDARLPRLIEAWRHSGSPERGVLWQLRAIEQYNHAGLYEASLPYAAEVEARLGDLEARDRELYLSAVNALYFCYVPLGHADAARAIVEQALSGGGDARIVARYCYLLAMLHARFLDAPDQSKAEGYLQQGLSLLAAERQLDHDHHFLTVFLMNGLAFVRLRQGRVQEAADLCSAGLARLSAHLHPERHRLHRSVLLFNIAQVHAQVGPYEDAIEYFSQAMEMDPNYSEYYNDRGAVYFKMDRLQDAERDYLRAIELSPPYAEVWVNLGQCYRAMERMHDAVRAYSRALDLDPACTLAVVGRADAYAAMDSAALALADYDQALTMEADQPLVLAGRAIVHYEAGRVIEAVCDLDAAVKLAPDLAELYQNRAVALRELGRTGDAFRDLSTYLELSPGAEDRDEVESSLASLQASGR